MLVEVNGKVFDDETHFIRKKDGAIISRKKTTKNPRSLNYDFILNFRINRELLLKYKEVCKNNNTNSSKMLKKFIYQIIDDEFGVKKLKNYFFTKENNTNVAIKIQKNKYDNFIEKVNNMQVKSSADLLRAYICYVVENSEKVFQEVFEKC